MGAEVLAEKDLLGHYDVDQIYKDKKTRAWINVYKFYIKLNVDEPVV
jgi:hypothetical protein